MDVVYVIDESCAIVDAGIVGAHIDIGTCASVHRKVVIVSMLVGASVMMTAASGIGWKVVLMRISVLIDKAYSRTVYVC